MALTSLGKDTETRRLGQGARREVYLAEDPDIGRSMANRLHLLSASAVVR